MTSHRPIRHQAGSAAVTVLSILVLGAVLGVLLLLLFGNRNNGADTVSAVVPGVPGTTLQSPASSIPSNANPSSNTSSSTSAAPKEGEAASGSPGEAAQTQANAAPEKTLEQTVVPGQFSGNGAQIYTQACQSCHMVGGKGAKGAGIYPALAGNPKLSSAAYAESMVLFGHGGMPGFGHYMSDEQISTIVNYVRTELNKNTDKVAPADIKKLRPADPHYMIFGEAAG